MLTPGRYAGLQDDEDGFEFKEQFTALKAEFESQRAEEELLNRKILGSLKRIKV